MQTNTTGLSCEIELRPGENLTLPQSLVDRVGPGQWRVTISPVSDVSLAEASRVHAAFLNGYVAEDEGLYGDS
jgi:hypothetical protein